MTWLNDIVNTLKAIYKPRIHSPFPITSILLSHVLPLPPLLDRATRWPPTLWIFETIEMHFTPISAATTPNPGEPSEYGGWSVDLGSGVGFGVGPEYCSSRM
ncbi:MAG TPA: hypothetical protein VMW53_02010 [archaeon]|nr:hypothetical protein [archaeon]